MLHEGAANNTAETDKTSGRSSRAGLQGLQQAALHLADIRRGSPRLKTRDLVNLLLCHAARSRRASLDRAHLGLRVYTPDNRVAVILVL